MTLIQKHTAYIEDVSDDSPMTQVLLGKNKQRVCQHRGKFLMGREVMLIWVGLLRLWVEA